MQRKTYRSGEAIVVEGEHTSDAFIIEAGTVAVSRGGKALRTLRPGEIFGEMALLTDQPRSATVTAVSDVTVRVIDHAQFEATWRRDPDALFPIVRVLCDRVRALNALVEELTQQSPQSRDTAAAHGIDVAHVAETARVSLTGVTPEARTSLGGKPRIIERFPFRIGRATAPGDPLSANELSVSDAPPFHVSRSHCALTLVGQRVFLIDRGSRLGTMVGPVKVITGATTRVELPAGTTEIALGGPRTPFRYAVTVGG
jgi:CRP-like cAMP-binding protein